MILYTKEKDRQVLSMQRYKKRVLAWRNRTTIRKQLSLIVGLAVTITMALLITFSFLSQESANTDRQVSMLHRVLDLELTNLNNYMKELRAFSLQLRNDSSFMELAAKASPLNHTQRQTVESALKASFYSRSDVSDMELYLVRQGLKYALNGVNRKVTLTAGVNAAGIPDYEKFTAKPDFIMVTEVKDGFLRITRTIIDSPRETPLAVVRITAGLNTVEAFVKSHADARELLCVLGAAGETYYLPSALSGKEVNQLKSLIESGEESRIMKISNRDTLCVIAGGSGSGFTLVGLKPMAVVNDALIATRNASVVLGLISLALTILLVVYCIRFITTPLSKLAHRLRGVGTGNFKTKAVLEGSYEIKGLSEDVNNMMDALHKLIESSYVAELNERTAQLIALEAQTNPHFLFNTLQAIATKAIVNKQDELYQMVTSLASLLRYSVKGGNLKPLSTELDHVEKYLSLQKARFGSRLTYEIHMEDKLLPLAVPKLGLLSLAENSITHGLKGDVTAIHIVLSARIRGEDAVFTVCDDGCGIDPDKLNELRAAITDPAVTITKNIGLMNLNSRLKLLYEGRARLEIKSESQPRLTAVTIAIPLEVLYNVQGAVD
jgi:two-component system, sensor histidine kinase YesM